MQLHSRNRIESSTQSLAQKCPTSSGLLQHLQLRHQGEFWHVSVSARWRSWQCTQNIHGLFLRAVQFRYITRDSVETCKYWRFSCSHLHLRCVRLNSVQSHSPLRGRVTLHTRYPSLLTMLWDGWLGLNAMVWSSQLLAWCCDQPRSQAFYTSSFDRLQYTKTEEGLGISSRDPRHNCHVLWLCLSTAKWSTRPILCSSYKDGTGASRELHRVYDTYQG